MSTSSCRRSVLTVQDPSSSGSTRISAARLASSILWRKACSATAALSVSLLNSSAASLSRTVSASASRTSSFSRSASWAPVQSLYVAPTALTDEAQHSRFSTRDVTDPSTIARACFCGSRTAAVMGPGVPTSRLARPPSNPAKRFPRRGGSSDFSEFLAVIDLCLARRSVSFIPAFKTPCTFSLSSSSSTGGLRKSSARTSEARMALTAPSARCKRSAQSRSSPRLNSCWRSSCSCCSRCRRSFSCSCCRRRFSCCQRRDLALDLRSFLACSLNAPRPAAIVKIVLPTARRIARAPKTDAKIELTAVRPPSTTTTRATLFTGVQVMLEVSTRRPSLAAFPGDSGPIGAYCHCARG
jgi:hypothetical protein